MNTATLVYVFDGGSVLMQRKSKGLFGGGKWNAPGGKVESGEQVFHAAARELKEETGLEPAELTCSGKLQFYLGAGEQLDQSVYVFTCSSFAGKARESREGKVAWFPKTMLPVDEMWEDDRYWLPLLLRNRLFTGGFYFTEGYAKLVKLWLSTDPFFTSQDNLIGKTFAYSVPLPDDH